MRITLQVGSTDAQITAAESLCAIAAGKWKNAAAEPTNTKPIPCKAEQLARQS